MSIPPPVPDAEAAGLVCPVSRTALRVSADGTLLVTDVAGLAYPIRDGVPVLLAEAAMRMAETDPEATA